MNCDERNAVVTGAMYISAGAMLFVALGVLTSTRLAVGTYLCAAAIAGVWFAITERRC